MPVSHNTVTLLTPAGRGAIATLAVRGPYAVQAVENCFESIAKKPFSQIGSRQIAFGAWQSTSAAREELVVCRVAEEHVEIHCHGGRSATAAIIASLTKIGVVEISAESFAREEATDAITAEAWLALSQARTERTALHLLAQYQGALRDAVEIISRCIEQGEHVTATKLIADLLQQTAFGLHLTQPWRVVLAGEPNVGKSSLMNALVGYARSIVFAEPGTTRDVVSALTAFDGWPVELLDTAGLRESRDEIESAGVQLSEEHIASADLVLLIADASAAWSQEYNAILARVPKALVVLNKIDLVTSPTFNVPHAHCFVSAITGEGIAQLGERIAERLIPYPPEIKTPLPFTPRQAELLTTAHDLITMSEPSQACEVLTRVIG